jgi:transposase
VKPFVKRQKNDMADAEAIAEAATRPTMRFVAVKSEEQQAMAMAYRTRDLLVRQRTQTINALRGHLAEYGVVAPAGVRGVPHRSPVGRGNAQHALQATDGCKAMVAFVPRQHP